MHPNQTFKTDRNHTLSFLDPSHENDTTWFIRSIIVSLSYTREVMVNGCIIDHVRILTTNKGGVSWDSNKECSEAHGWRIFYKFFFSCSFIGDRVLNKAILFYRNYLSSVLIQEIFLTLDHDDLSQRAKVRNSVLRKQNLFLLPRFSNPPYELRTIWTYINL